jgi:hypothetical protein
LGIPTPDSLRITRPETVFCVGEIVAAGTDLLHLLYELGARDKFGMPQTSSGKAAQDVP